MENKSASVRATQPTGAAAGPTPGPDGQALSLAAGPADLRFISSTYALTRPYVTTRAWVREEHTIYEGVVSTL